MEKLTSRERVIRALNHQETDRVPIDIGGLYNLSTLHKDAYIKLNNYLKINEEESVEITYNPSQSVCPDEEIRQRFKADCHPVYLNSPANHEAVKKIDETTYIDEWGIRWEKPGSSLYYNAMGHPLANCSIEDVKNFKTPDPEDPQKIEGLQEKARDLYENTEYCLVANGPLGGTVYSACHWLMGFEEFLMKMVSDKDTIEALLEKVLDYQKKQWNVFLDQVGEFVDVAVLADDLGTQSNPIMSPKTYRDLIKPVHKELVSSIKAKADIKIVYHCDGAVEKFIPDFIDIGFDAWNPIQVSAKGMDDTARLKKEYGDDLTFWGAGCDSQDKLSNGTPEEIRQEVKRRVNDLASGGGLVLSSIHNIQKDVPVENIVAFYDALYEFGTDFYQNR